MRIAVAGGTGAVGRRIVEAAQAKGHEPVVLARSTGVDVLRADGLAAALTGCAAVIDVTSVGTLNQKRAVAFFSAATRNLLAAERAAGVPHHIALSIVGAAAADAGYYAGKAAQERIVMAQPGGWTVLRATQFHEFAAQTVARGATLGVYPVPAMRCQPVAASEVAQALVEIAEGAPRGLDRELAGPRPERMADMVRRYLASRGRRGRVLEVALPGRFGRALAGGGILPAADARLGVLTFEEWLKVGA